MTESWEIVRQTKAQPAKVVDYFMHPENLPKFHPDIVKSVTIERTDENSVIFGGQFTLMNMKVTARYRIHFDQTKNMMVIDTIGGDGTGSRIAMVLVPKDTGGTEIRYNARMELGPLAFFARGPVRIVWEKAADEDMMSLDSSTSSTS